MSEPLHPDDPVRLGSMRLLSRLGSGGMGRVYLGRTAGGRLVAVKTVHTHLAEQPHFRERFRREAAAARSVTGAYTAAVLDADPGSAVPWLATAYLPGMTLRQVVAASGALDATVVRALGAALAEALTDIHGAGLVHRDLKPSNVLVTADGPRVIDFGIARALGHQGLTGTGDIIGTPGFIAPEQIVDGGEVTAAADVFSLGAVLAFAATGRNPFGDGAVAVLLYRAVHEEPALDEVPAEVRELIADCLRKDPNSRPSVPAVLERAADPGAPMWWREDPLRSLVLGEHDLPETGTAVLPTSPQIAPEAAEPEAGRGQGKLPEPHGPEAAGEPPDREERERGARRRELARRSVLLAAGGGLAGVFGVSVARGWGKSERSEDIEDAWELTLKKGSSQPGALRWKLTAEQGEIDAMLLADGTVLLHGSDGADSSSARVRACATSGGDRRWERKAEGGIPKTWSVSDQMVLAGEVGLPAVALASGRDGGKAAAELPSDALWFTVADGTLIAAYQRPDASDGRELIRGIRLHEGTKRWTRKIDTAQTPAVLGSSVLFTTSQETDVTCIDVATAKTLWTYPLGSAEDERVAALSALPGAESFAVLTVRGALHLLDARSGDRTALGKDAYTVTTGALALGAADDTGLLITAGRLHAFDPETAEPRWDVATLGVDSSWPLRTGGLRGPVTADGVVLHWSKADTVQTVNLASGEERWERRLEGVAKVPPAVVGDTVYAAAGERCTALRLTDGRPEHTWTLPGIIGELAADASGWYARSGSSSVRAFNPTRRGP